MALTPVILCLNRAGEPLAHRLAALLIDESLAARQPEDQWQARADWQAHNYQARLRG